MMAEFAEVMKQWRRFCKSHNHCGECEFDGKGICGEAHLSEIPYADIEQRVMAWAKEHPEPVYPTWLKWLGEQGILNVTMLPTDTCGGIEIHGTITGKAYEHIPADIAQKLGIEPKEG